MDELHRDVTYEQKYGPAMEIEDEEEAAAHFERCVRHTMSFDIGRKDAERLVRTQLAYWAAYHGNEVRERVERLFCCEHPVLGKIAEKGPPTPEQAYLAGYNMATKRKANAQCGKDGTK